MLILILLAQIHVSQFKRLPVPRGMEWKSQNKTAVVYKGHFAIPKSGHWTIKYDSLYPADYASKNFPVIPEFCEKEDCAGGNKEPIYDIDESYDHITVQAKPGTKWFYSITVVIPSAHRLNK